MPPRGAKAREMSARPSQRFYTRVGTLLLLAGSGSAAACDDGEVAIAPLAAAGRDAGALTQAGTGAAAAGTGRPGEPRAGAGGMPRLAPPGCDESTALELDEEQELREAFIETYNSGNYCPNLSNAERRSLVPDRDLEWRARLAGCVAFDSAEWVRVSPRTPVMAWVLIATPSLEDAKRALLGGDRTELCEEAERTALRHVGVGHVGSAWAVFVAPGPSDEMQKP